MRKRILSILLCLVMVVGLFPTMAFAADGSGATTGSGTKSDPYCVSTYAEMKRLLQTPASSYIKVVGMDNDSANEGVPIRRLKAGRDFESTKPAIDIPSGANHHLEIATDIWFMADRKDGDKNIFSRLIDVESGSSLEITGTGSLRVEVNALTVKNAIIDNWGGELTIDGSVTLNGIQDLTSNVATRPIWIDGGVTNIKGGYIYGHNNMKATSDDVTSAISFGNKLAYGTELNISGGTIKQVNNATNQRNENSCALYVDNDKAANAIHLTGGIFEGGMKMENGKPLSNLLTAGYQFYDMDANTAFDGSVSKTQKKLIVTPTGVDNPKVIDNASLTVKSPNERKTLSDLACGYSPNNKMVLDNFVVFEGLNNQWDKIEDQNTPYDANQEYTVMYVFEANEGFSYSSDIKNNVSVSGGDFWKADGFGGTTILRVFVNFPACTIDNAKLTIKSPNERRTLSDLECSYSPNTKMVLDNFVVFEGLNNQWDKIEDQTKPYDANQDYTVMYVFEANEGFSYSSDIKNNVSVSGGDFWKADTFGGTYLLRVFVNFPREEVPHSITVTNGRGTANPTTAFAGDTVTVKANDWSNMMFTQWYTKTAGVTFADATKQETTFVMPNCDVQVYPGYQAVSFTKQPVPQISLEKGYGGKTSFVFSWDISKWELVDTATNQPVNSGDTLVKAGKLTDVTIPANTDLGSKTYRIVVTTANGEQFKSNDFIVTWFEKMPAPLVEFSIPSGTKFIGELTVNVGYPDELNDSTLSPYEMRYTTNGVDPKDADPSDVEDCHGSTDVTLNNTTTIKARTILEGEGGNEDTWGELCVASYEMIDKLDAPTVTPESCSYSGSLPIIVTIQDVYNAKIDYSVKQHDGYLSGGDEPGPMLETGLPDTFCGTTTFSAKAIVYKDGGGAWESDEVTYTYTREYWANISNATISGKVNKAIADTDVTITLDGEKFKDVAVGDDVSGWFNLPAGLTAKVKEQTSYSRELVITISGTPTATSAAAITVTIPKDKLLANGTVDLTVLSNPKAVYNIGTDVVHEHTFGEWTPWDDSKHYKSCTCGDMQFADHAFGNWTPDPTDADKHFKECFVCHRKVGANHVESNKITVTPAGIGTPGAWHTVCFDCGKQMNTGMIPALEKIDVVKLTVAKPVKDAAAEMATTGDATYTVANTEWTAADGATLTIGEKFKPGTAYTVKITLEAKDNNVFTADSTYNKIEGKDAKLVTAVTGYTDSVILTYTFDATEGTYVPTKPAITTVALPDGKVGDAYSQTLAATGTNPITWNVETGALPDGLTLVGDTIKGTPSKAGDFKFTVKATNGGGSDTKELTIKVADAEAAKYHNVTLSGAGTGATGAGSHAAGTTVNIYAGTKSGYTFNGWTSDDVTVLSASNKNASFVMPDKDVTVKANWVYNGGGSSGGGYTYYTIKATAGVNGSISPTGNVSVREGRDQTFTITPNKGYAVAKVLIDSKNVGAVKSYTFENVKKNHTIEVVFMKASGNPQTGVFVDVPEGSYYEEAVNWAVEKGITTGTDATHFSPNGICTRAQAVTFLWRAAGSPAAKSAVMPFTDVKAGSYYYDAVLWAVENGITKGTSDTMFSPDATCSRAQIVTFLWRSQKSPAAGTANPFTDVKASAYYADAVLWAVKEDVTKGTTNTTFSPDANCTRAQIVTFIWRALAE